MDKIEHLGDKSQFVKIKKKDILRFVNKLDDPQC